MEALHELGERRLVTGAQPLDQQLAPVGIMLRGSPGRTLRAGRHRSPPTQWSARGPGSYT